MSKIICLVGPSGSGKTAICEELIKDKHFEKVRTATTREIRDTESPDAYFFIPTKEEFEKMKEDGKFLETSVYAGEYYGTPFISINAILDADHYAVAPVDINGALAYKGFYGDKCKAVFMYRNKRTVIEEILKRNISTEEKAKRIIQLDREYDNIASCDMCVMNVSSIVDAAEMIKKMML